MDKFNREVQNANSGSLIMSVPFVLKCLLSPNRKEVMEVFEYRLPSPFLALA